ncbi:hypothetical protein WJX72_007539 [[Myrmecia] bisecta]|uniref:Ubiquitin-like domain-containing protein n=1 Tax=[Myrmecia] bisecta TaxID=41462 RepID=A0AAW1PK70_9CHLO
MGNPIIRNCNSDPVQLRVRDLDRVEEGGESGDVWVKMKRSQKLKELQRVIASRKSVEVGVLEFSYKGKPIDGSLTPDDLGMQDIDFVEVQTSAEALLDDSLQLFYDSGGLTDAEFRAHQALRSNAMRAPHQPRIDPRSHVDPRSGIVPGSTSVPGSSAAQRLAASTGPQRRLQALLRARDEARALRDSLQRAEQEEEESMDTDEEEAEPDVLPPGPVGDATC